jgi:hypothetical protein
VLHFDHIRQESEKNEIMRNVTIGYREQPRTPCFGGAPSDAETTGLLPVAFSL